MSPGAARQTRCDICEVELTSRVCMKEHLLGRQHQQKAKDAPHRSSGEQSAYISVAVTKELSEVEIREICDVFETFGELSDFRFSVVEKGKTKPKNGSNIYVKYQTKDAGRKALAGSQSEQLIHTVGKVKKRDEVKKREEVKKQDEAKKKKKEEVSCDPTNHTMLLTTLSHMLHTRTEEDVLRWLADQLLLTPAEHQQRVQLCLDLQAALRTQFRTCLVQAFGSSVSGLGFRGCDLDLYAFIDASNPGSGLPPDADDRKKVRVVANVLYRQPRLCSDIVRIPATRVPIIKFRAPRLGDIQCDMSFRDPMSCQNSRLIGWMMKADPRARLVAVAVRYWAKRRQLAGGDHHPQKMSSYCLTLLLVTFLQQLKPAVLPSVDWCQASVDEMLIGPWNAAFAPTAIWRSANTTPACQLLRQFFRFYADFAAELEALCPLRGGPVPRAQLADRLAGRQLARPAVWAGFCDLVASGRVEPLAVDTPLVLQDPMELNYNVARNLRQLGLNRFRQCCREAVGMPLNRLFDEQALPKAPKHTEEAAVAAAAAVVAAAANTAANTSDRAAKRTLETADGRGDEPAATKAKHNSGDDGRERVSSTTDASTDQSPEVSSSNGKAAPPVAGGGAGGDAAPSAGAAQSVALAEDPALLRRVLADFERPPSRVASLALTGSTAAERRRHAAAFVRLIEEVFSGVLRFECRSMTFDGLDLTTDVVRGFACTARLPTWNFRKSVAAQLVGRQRTLEFETEVTERALRMEGMPAPTPLAAFSCYVVLEGDQLRLCFYEGETVKAGKNCHTFVASFLLEMAKRV